MWIVELFRCMASKESDDDCSTYDTSSQVTTVDVLVVGYDSILQHYSWRIPIIGPPQQDF